MKSNIPWSVKGIDPEAREAAKVAARRAGMTLGEWLNSLILQSGELPEGLAQLAAEAAAGGDFDDDDDDFDDASSAADELQSRLENLNRQLNPADRAAAVAGIDESIARLTTSIENSRRLLASGEYAQRSITDLGSRVERMQTRLEEVASQHRSGLEPKTLIALERAIAGVASHIEKSDRRNTELVQSVEDALGQLGSRVDGAEQIANGAVNRIDHALDRLGGRIDNSESEARRNAARMNERLAQLDERMAHTGLERETTLATVERRLSNFENKLQNMQGRVDSAASQRPNMPPDVMTRVEFDEWSRRQQSDLSLDTSSVKRSVSALEARLGSLLDRMDRLRSDTDTQVRDADRKAEEAVRQAQAKVGDVQLAAVADLRSSVDEIAQKFDHSSHTATETMSALEGVLRSLTRRLDVIEGKQARADGDPSRTAQAEPESDLPRRPALSWAINRQDRVQVQPVTPATPATPAAPVAPVAVAPPAAQSEMRAVEEIASHPDDVVEIAAAIPDGDEVTVDADGVAEAHFGTAGEQPGTTRQEPEVDLSSLVFDLKGVRGTDAEPEPAEPTNNWQRAGWQDRPAAPVEAEPPEAEEDASAGGWLEQARRAARSAAPAEGIGTEFEEEHRRNPARVFLIVFGIVALLAVVIAAGIIFGRPLFEKKGSASHPAAAQQQHSPAPASGSLIAPATHAPTDSEATTTPAISAPVVEGAPSENDIGQPLPNEETAQSGESAPAPATPASPEDAMIAAAKAGNPRAEYALSLAYQNGRGVETDGVKAVQLMTDAAQKQLAVAQRTLGIWYEQGDGVTKDLTKAREWYEKAANNGDVQAMHNLGFFYAQGMGGLQRDGALAQKWFKNAAEKGLVASQVNLAIIYAQSASYGMTAQNDQAYLWSAIAARSGDQEAVRMRDQIVPALPADVKARMDKQAAEWKRKPVDIVANGGFDSSPEAFLATDKELPLSRAEMTSVQEMLNELGFTVGTADGRTGAQTTNAIKAFQSAYGLEATGKADQELLAALNAVPR